MAHAALKLPVLCLITDRRRMGGPPDDLQRLLALIRQAAKAGVDLVQIRETGLTDRVLFDLVREAIASVAGSATRVVVNDRLDIARAAGAFGVHLKGTSPPPARIHSVLAPLGVVGRSVHSVDEAVQVEEAGGVDYLVAGPVFETVSKPGLTGTGVEAFGEIARAVTLPVLAIGGVTVECTARLARAGAAGVAAIGAFVDAGEDLARLVRRFRLQFDKTQPSLL